MTARHFLVIFLGLGMTAAWALEPPTRAEIDRYLKDGSFAERAQRAYALGNHLIAPELILGLKDRLERIRLTIAGRSPSDREGLSGLPPATRNTLKSKGSVKILALLISFSDYPAVNTVPVIASKLFGAGDTGWPYESLRSYYRRASYGALDIGGDVLGWYTPSFTRDSMPMTAKAREDLIKEALTYYDARGQDFSQYDNDNNGTIDYFVVVWTGPNNGWANFWWGYQTSFGDSTFKLDGKSFSQTRYSWQWEARNWPGAYDQVVVMHETGHALGLPDYYDYDATVGPKGGLGGLDMMDANRGDHNCFSKMLLDWITPQSFTFGTRSFGLGASSTTQDALILMPEFLSSKPFDEFTMIQNRFRAENDFNLPGDGLVLWHVDARLTSGGGFLYNNSYTDHKLLRLMEADGLEHIEKGYSATAADYYVAGKTFGPQSFPGSDRYDRTSSGVSVFAIGPNGPNMNFTADIHYVLESPVGLGLARLESDYIFYKEHINKLTWSLSPKNRTTVAKIQIYRKIRGAPDDSYLFLAEVPGGTTVYEHKGLKKDQVYSYWLVAVDTNGAASGPAEVSNLP